MNKLLRLACVVFVLLLVTSPAVARASDSPPASSENKKEQRKDDAKKSSHPHQAPKVEQTIVVTATRTQRIASDVPVSMTVISAGDVEETPARNADDLLRTVPGVDMPLGSTRVLHFAQDHFSMRGLGDVRALVLLDGVPLNDAYGGYINWLRVSEESIKQVEVVRGAGASLFGNYALGGTVNLLTRHSSNDRIGIDLSTGSYGTQRGHIAVSHRLSDTLSVGLDLMSTRSDGFNRTLPASRGAIDVPSDYHTTNVTLRTDWTPTVHTSLWARANYLDHFTRLGTPLSWFKMKGPDLWAGGQSTIGNNSFTGSAFFDNQTEPSAASRNDATRSTEYLSTLGEPDIHDRGASLQWTRSVSASIPQISVGVDLRQMNVSEDRNSYNSSGDLTLRYLVQGSQRFAGLFGLVSWTPTPRIEVLTSARVDNYRSYDGAEVEPNAVTNFPSRTATQLSPRISVRFEITPRIAIRTATYRAFRAPTLSDLYRRTTYGRVVIIPNPNLDPETMTGSEVGVNYGSPRLSAEVNIFRNDVDNLLTSVYLATTPLIERTTQNVGSARTEGIEVMTTWRPARRLELIAGYTATSARITSNPADPSLEGKKIIDVPGQTGTLTVRWAADSGFRALVRGRAESPRPFDARNTQTVGGIPVFDLSASWPLRNDTEVFCSVENVFDRIYLVDRSATDRIGDRRQVTAGVRIDLPGRFSK